MHVCMHFYMCVRMHIHPCRGNRTFAKDFTANTLRMNALSRQRHIASLRQEESLHACSKVKVRSGFQVNQTWQHHAAAGANYVCTFLRGGVLCISGAGSPGETRGLAQRHRSGGECTGKNGIRSGPLLGMTGVLGSNGHFAVSSFGMHRHPTTSCSCHHHLIIRSSWPPCLLSLSIPKRPHQILSTRQYRISCMLFAAPKLNSVQSAIKRLAAVVLSSRLRTT